MEIFLHWWIFGAEKNSTNEEFDGTMISLFLKMAPTHFLLAFCILMSNTECLTYGNIN